MSNHTQTTFTIIVDASTDTSTAHHSAQKFVAAINPLQHHIAKVFFYANAAAICGQFADDSPNKITTRDDWLKISEKYNFPLQACITSALKRGVVDLQQAADSTLDLNLVEGFSLEGLGAIAESLQLQQTIVEFGG